MLLYTLLICNVISFAFHNENTYTQKCTSTRRWGDTDAGDEHKFWHPVFMKSNVNYRRSHLKAHMHAPISRLKRFIFKSAHSLHLHTHTHTHTCKIVCESNSSAKLNWIDLWTAHLTVSGIQYIFIALGYLANCELELFVCVALLIMTPKIPDIRVVLSCHNCRREILSCN